MWRTNGQCSQMNATTRPFGPRTWSDVTVWPFMSGNWKAGSGVPRSSIVDGVAGMVQGYGSRVQRGKGQLQSSAMQRFSPLIGVVCAAILLRTLASAQGDDLLFDALEHPAIGYDTATLHDPVAELSRRMQKREAALRFEPGSGYLRSLVAALRIPIESQIAVFSKTSLQSP